MDQARERAKGTVGDAAGSAIGDAPDRVDTIAAGPVRPAQQRRQQAAALTKGKRQGFLDVLAATANVQRAAASVGCAPSSFYRLRYRDGGFAAAWREALDSAMVRLESEVLAHALGEREEMTGDAERAGEAGRIDVAVAMQLLTRRGPTGSRGMAQRKRLPIEDVERALLKRLDAMARRKVS